MPAAAVASFTPAIAGISGTSVGASGETEVDIGAPYRDEGFKTWMPGLLARAYQPNYSTLGAKSIYFFAGAILLSAGLAGSAGLVSDFAASAGFSVRSILAASRSLPTYSACALRVT